MPAHIMSSGNARERPLTALQGKPVVARIPQIGGILWPKYSAMMCCATGAATLAP
jgi:hypothetical protein